MTSPVFTIHDLRCGYRAAQPVLVVDRVDIPRGKMVFVVGISGGGKSTLIETLGLMNHTTGLAGLGGSVQYTPGAGRGRDLLSLWEKGDAKLSEFRQRQFSFIFQQTNLMPNFSSGENMLLTALFAGQDRGAAEAKVRRLMKRIHLPGRAFDAPIQELSGGQRQRLSFIRALVADYEVLFGDEPTGNLDAATARECMQLLRDELTLTNRTAVIVTHDLPLAVRFADLVIPITLQSRADGTLYGQLDAASLLTRNEVGSLTTPNEVVLPDPVSHLQEHILNAPTI